MTIPKGFLAAILANPADDTPRLILADWLEENGQESRAEFIRVQIELASVIPKAQKPWGKKKHGERLVFLLTREGELWKEIHRDFDIGVPSGSPLLFRSHEPTSLVIRDDDGKVLIRLFPRRGFVYRVECAWSTWINYADRFRSRAPIQEVRTTTATETIWNAKMAATFTRLTWPGIKFTWPT